VIDGVFAGAMRMALQQPQKEKLTKLYEQLTANEHGSAPPFGKAHSFVPHQAASSEVENSPLTSKLAKSAVSLHMTQPCQKSRTSEENSLLTSELAKRTVRYTSGSFIKRSKERGRSTLC
jgi:hypothetical protein